MKPSYPLFSHEYFMGKALDLAQQAFEEGEVPVGALVVTENNKIIGKGYNQTEKLNDVTAHAEMLAITAAANALDAKYLRDCRLYVTLEPCSMCAGAIAWSQVDEIIFAASDLKRGYTQFSDRIIHAKKNIVSGILSSESEALLKVFFQKLRT
ncbi:nucleoside deaminase [Marinilongibacter aquaticus]|uniref:nucleoside deaminase n=1 Tax=Marinilongibacter aquaticus TaxID=2975157 RepID=UPI0021BD3815|nr:nucleoside deaminase [Marinilongibacter aquaticus]UBM57335.1 nucleoside deaminase [Marinilongibacter aquaticus]